MSKQLVISAFALAALALGGCSAEPSDWRPDKKVSLDMVAPGSRSSENYDHDELVNNEKSGAIAEPVSSGVTLDEPNIRKRTNAEESRTANDPTAPLTNSPEAMQSVKKASDTTATKALKGPKK
ncbi:hypothetical protein D0N36_01340 [Hymenobacter lapidiphilus]|uniref:hypothetical protein n=1 Tax=Hymenobacter sp. CCM 8763 TaxID=2303334 RepID=UPI000E342022|nr:hypothetical protein [Hymenobacter sp. CCM 8763]RFP66755.1 hypothetical protein D0N36_01340 [Hymenobacter sp. CCM 8763]